MADDGSDTRRSGEYMVSGGQVWSHSERGETWNSPGALLACGLSPISQLPSVFDSVVPAQTRPPIHSNTTSHARPSHLPPPAPPSPPPCSLSSSPAPAPAPAPPLPLPLPPPSGSPRPTAPHRLPPSGQRRSTPTTSAAARPRLAALHPSLRSARSRPLGRLNIPTRAL